jgi:hypothetical protein
MSHTTGTARIMAAGLFAAGLLALASPPYAQTALTSAVDDPDARPPVTRADREIVRRARAIIASPAQWNRADNRQCRPEAKTFSIYCALEKATIDAGLKFEHRGAALQEVRFVIDEISVDRNYEHRLMDYNNDPRTSFADMQQVFHIAEELIVLRLGAAATAPSAVH